MQVVPASDGKMLGQVIPNSLNQDGLVEINGRRLDILMSLCLQI